MGVYGGVSAPASTWSIASRPERGSSAVGRGSGAESPSCMEAGVAGAGGVARAPSGCRSASRSSSRCSSVQETDGERERGAGSGDLLQVRSAGAEARRERRAHREPRDSRTPPARKARRVRFFRNGDRFHCGCVVPVLTERYRWGFRFLLLFAFWRFWTVSGAWVVYDSFDLLCFLPFLNKLFRVYIFVQRGRLQFNKTSTCINCKFHYMILVFWYCRIFRIFSYLKR